MKFSKWAKKRIRVANSKKQTLKEANIKEVSSKRKYVIRKKMKKVFKKKAVLILVRYFLLNILYLFERDILGKILRRASL